MSSLMGLELKPARLAGIVVLAGAGAAFALWAYKARKRAHGECGSSGRLQAKRGTARVSEICIYPVKSCAEVRSEKATACAAGFRGDRVFQVTDAQGNFCTPRDKDMVKLFHIRCHLDASKLVLTAGSTGASLTVDLGAPTADVEAKVLGVPRENNNFEKLQDYGSEAAQWLASATGIEGCRLHGIGPKYRRIVMLNPSQSDPVPVANATVSLADEAPYLLASVASLDDLNRRLTASKKSPVDMRRFRPNIIIEGLQPWEEDTWKKIRIGGVEFWNWQRCARCDMVTIDRETLERSKEPLNTMGHFRKRQGGKMNFGMHLVPVEGLPVDGVELRVGDVLEVLEYDSERVAEFEQEAELDAKRLTTVQAKEQAAAKAKTAGGESKSAAKKREKEEAQKKAAAGV